MITINEISVNEKNFLSGQIGKTSYSIESTPEAKERLMKFKQQLEEAATYQEAVELMEQANEAIQAFTVASSNELEEKLKDDLFYNPKNGKYYVKYEDKVSKKPIHKFFVKKMMEAADKGADPKPWLIFWVRLMRNLLYRNNKSKVNTIVEFLKAQYVDKDNVEKLMEEQGFSENVATKLSTFDQVSITEQGILAAFKYVRLITEKYEVETDKETGLQAVVLKDRYTRTLEVDDVTGEITKDELNLPEFAEDILFSPPIMGTRGEAFSSRAIDEEANSNPGHIIKVGMIHELPDMSYVNTSDKTSGVQGLHTGRIAAA